MRRAAFVLCLVVFACAAANAQQGSQKPEKKSVDVSGNWTMTLDMAMGTANPTLVLKQDGEKLAGTYTGRYGTFDLLGSVKDRAIQFTFTMNAEGQTATMAFVGEVAEDGQSMKGTAQLDEMGDATWSAKKDKEAAKPPSAFARSIASATAAEVARPARSEGREIPARARGRFWNRDLGVLGWLFASSGPCPNCDPRQTVLLGKTVLPSPLK